MEFQQFNEDYVRRLAEGDRVAEEHFAAYFGELLYLKLRARRLPPDLIDEIPQETFARVLQVLRQGGGLTRPGHLSAFVNAVSNNVILEKLRDRKRYPQLGPDVNEPPDNRVDFDAPLINQELKRQVERVLAGLSKRDRNLLRMIFLEEVDKAEACKRLQVEEGYLRVLLHRAKSRCRDKVAKRGASAA